MPAPLKLVESSPLSPARAALRRHLDSILEAEKPLAALDATWSRLQAEKQAHVATQAATQAQKTEAVERYREWINGGCRGAAPAPALDTAEAAQATAALEAIAIAQKDLDAKRQAEAEKLNSMRAATVGHVVDVLAEAGAALQAEIETMAATLRDKLVMHAALQQSLVNAGLVGAVARVPNPKMPAPPTPHDVHVAAAPWKLFAERLGNGEVDALPTE